MRLLVVQQDHVSDLAGRTPGSGVGVIGLCFTGGLALAAAVDETVAASVVSQPAMPFPVTRLRRADPTMSPAEFDRVAARAEAGGVCSCVMPAASRRLLTHSPAARASSTRPPGSHKTGLWTAILARPGGTYKPTPDGVTAGAC